MRVLRGVVLAAHLLSLGAGKGKSVQDWSKLQEPEFHPGKHGVVAQANQRQRQTPDCVGSCVSPAGTVGDCSMRRRCGLDWSET